MGPSREFVGSYLGPDGICRLVLGTHIISGLIACPGRSYGAETYMYIHRGICGRVVHQEPVYAAHIHQPSGHFFGNSPMLGFGVRQLMSIYALRAICTSRLESVRVSWLQPVADNITHIPTTESRTWGTGRWGIGRHRR